MPTPDEPAPNRIDAIDTRWSLIRRAHATQVTLAGEARNQLVTRYADAIRRYAGAILRDDARADELAQDALVRMLQGDFRVADPGRGRFRDFLKVAVRNMIRHHWEKENRRRPANVDVQQLELPEDPSADDAEWVGTWRRSVLDKAWKGLAEYQRTHEGSIDHTLLKLRMDFPDYSSEQLAGLLGTALGGKVRADAVRQKLRRARVRFAELLLEEVAGGLDEPTADSVEQELIDLGLWEQVREYLPADWKDV